MKKNLVIIFLIIIIITLSGVVYFLVREEQTEKINTEIKKVDTKNEKSIIEDSNLAINQSTVTTENDLINYLDGVEKEVDIILEDDIINSSAQNKLKNTFITLTDFIFYDGEIKEKKFDDLTANCKEKILNLYTKIDEKIESKFPNYKENIKSTSKKVYDNLKEKTVSLKEKILEEYKDYVGEEPYNSTIDFYEEDKINAGEVYDTYKPYIETSKEKVTSVIENAKKKLENWYQEFKES